MRKLTCIATVTLTAAKLWTDCCRVMKPARVPTAGLLAGMYKWTVCPVMAPAASTAPDLELKHAELIGGVGVAGVIVGGVGGAIVGKVLVPEGVIGKHVAGDVVDGGGAAGEELPWWDWDVYVPQGFLEGEKLVRGLKLEFVF